MGFAAIFAAIFAAGLALGLVWTLSTRPARAEKIVVAVRETLAAASWAVRAAARALAVTRAGNPKMSSALATTAAFFSVSDAVTSAGQRWTPCANSAVVSGRRRTAAAALTRGKTRDCASCFWKAKASSASPHFAAGSAWSASSCSAAAPRRCAARAGSPCAAASRPCRKTSVLFDAANADAARSASAATKRPSLSAGSSPFQSTGTFAAPSAAAFKLRRGGAVKPQAPTSRSSTARMLGRGECQCPIEASIKSIPRSISWSAAP
ncbi:hypothetical protein M885DRAFT_528719 [Pelagophyceae sp. CCMP2097]|nr:hypothetical protein M885DRAFT_528719 [Pelagophyceae sp. CCMP2097]